MDLKHLLLASFLLLFVAFQSASAGKNIGKRTTTRPPRTLPRLLYDRNLPDDLAELKGQGLACRPGRTIIIVKEDVTGENSDDDSVEGDTRRTHTRHTPSHDETCNVCICSAAGKDEICLKRPAANVNECLYRAKKAAYTIGNNPYDHERSLQQMIRRDLIWEVPQDMPEPVGAVCPRGQSYYTNDENCLNSEVYNGITLPPDTWDRLDFCNRTICFFCVCTVDGFEAKCLPRSVWFCDYYRKRKDPNFIKVVYNHLFGQDRAAYFWTLSARMRRSMDDGIFALLDAANANDDKFPECVPFVSQYTDCSDANRCLGCKRCSCTASGRWSCNSIKECSGADDFRPPADTDLQNALGELQNYLQRYTGTKSKYSRSQQGRDSVIVEEKTDVGQDFVLRKKRAISKQANKNGSIIFHHSVDELNEDTLKNSTHLGTIEAQKIKPVKLPMTRRMDTYMEHNSNLSALETLHIEFNHPQAYARHVTDNKLDSTHGVEHHDSLSHDKLQTLLNKTRTIKDKDLSKLVVNELKKGQERIGDKNAPVISNITFTPENDTLTAIAFIAGNLLNKLWSIEKYESDESMEVEVLKHEKIAELLDLFKEPMTMKQEKFLKSALEKLSNAVDKNKNTESVSLCKDVEETKKRLQSSNKTSEDASDYDTNKEKTILRDNDEPDVSPSAAEKLRHVLDLIKKFEHVQSNLNNLKLGKSFELDKSTDKPKNHLNQYGKILEKLTQILIPNKNKNKKRIAKKVKNQHLFSQKEDFVEKVNRLYGVDIGNVSLTPKDRLLMDYLLNVEKAPDCILRTKTRHAAPLSKIEGEILFNLSEFFKVRSFVDLISLIDPKKAKDLVTTEITTTTTTSTTRKPSARKNNISDLENESRSISLAKTKEKLKSHLKSIIEDLTELQNVKGGSPRNLSITDLLPCLSNVLNRGRNNVKELGATAAKKIENMFSMLENEQTGDFPTRRTTDSIERPKSAVVWERIVNSFDRLPTRRLLENPKVLTFENLKQLMALSLEKNNLKTYENVEDYTDVPASEKLIFLKSIRQDSNRLKDVLDAIVTFADNTPALKIYDASELETYVDQVVRILHIAQNLFSVLKVNKRFQPKDVVKPSPRPQLTMLEQSKVRSLINEHKLTREQILKQLVKNRVMLFKSMKETSGIALNDDTSYQIAVRALKSLENGDYALAKELYKAIVTHKLQKPHPGGSGKEVPPATRFSVAQSRLVDAPPVARFEEPEQPSQDQLLQQLLNISSLKLR